MPGSLHVLSALHLLAAISASAHVVLHHPQARGAALWLVIIWLVPWLGPLLYVLIGINRVPRPARAIAAAGRHADGAWTQGNDVVPLVGGDAAYPAMIQAIDAAARSVHLVTYIFDNDRAGATFCDAMARAVQRGVSVRVLIDAVGARYSRPSIVARLRAAGVSVARFLPTSKPWRWPYANLRNHRKLMVVDGAVGFAGGMNIREACVQALAPAAPTLDTHFRIAGPVVADIAALFVADWAFATGELVPETHALSPGEPGTTEARLVRGGPDRTDEPIRWLKLAAVVRADRRVRIVTPYFVPDEDVVTALCAATASGVRIQLVMPSVNNLRLVAWASRACWPRLLERDIDIVLTPPPFEHTKLMLIDDDLAIIGSANWDERSFRLNFEADLECRDPALVARLDAVVDRRIAGGAIVTLDQLASASTWSRLRDGAARLALPYL